MAHFLKKVYSESIIIRFLHQDCRIERILTFKLTRTFFSMHEEEVPKFNLNLLVTFSRTLKYLNQHISVT
jgi:hypothetical protein